MILLLLFFDIKNENKPATKQTQELFHIHVDFKVFISGQEMDFALPQYSERDRRMHLHTQNDFGGSVIHVEDEKTTLGEFFASLSMKFNSTCFITDSEFCDTETKTLKFYVNDVENNEHENYKPRDLDRMLISYGNESKDEIQKQLSSIIKLACVFSNKCPIPEGVKIVTL